MTLAEENFLKAYYKACHSSQPEDWLEAAVSGKRLYNETRKPENKDLEKEIQDQAQIAHEARS